MLQFGDCVCYSQIRIPPPKVDGAMASFLSDLPAEARSLIDEMSQHWHDLERLKATGGTPTALIMKGLRVGRAKDGAMAFVVRNQEDYIRNVVCNPRNRCWMCDYDRAIGELSLIHI